MLTCKNISPSQGKDYYAKDNCHLNELSLWYGSGAAHLNLSGRVNSAVLDDLLAGKLPDGTAFRTRKPTKPHYKERGALDYTFSCPKSVSIMALVCKDKRILYAHLESVKSALNFTESYIATRIYQGGRRQVTKTNNAVIAILNHTTSRALDPHLHSHCLIVNMTLTGKGKWYSLHNGDLYKHKKLIGQLYQSELARRIKELGYQIDRINEHGQFEITSVPTEINLLFSQRNRDIRNQLASSYSWKQKEQIWRDTRQSKQFKTKRIEICDLWQKKIAQFNSDLTLSIPKKRDNRINLKEQELRKLKLNEKTIEVLSRSTNNLNWERLQQNLVTSFNSFSLNEIFEGIASNDSLMFSDRQIRLLPNYFNSQSIAPASIISKNQFFLTQPGKKQAQAIIFSTKTNKHLEKNYDLSTHIKHIYKKLDCLKLSDKQLYDPKKAYQSQKYREKYLLEKERVLLLDEINSIDCRIAIELFQKSIPVKEIRRILYQSDYIRSLNSTTDEKQFSVLAATYVANVEKSALSSLQTQQIKFKIARDNNLDLDL